MKLPFLAVALLACSGDPVQRRDQFFESGQSYLQEERYEEAVIQFLNALRIDDDHLPSRLALARTYQRSGQHANAREEFVKVLERDSSHLEAKLEIGKYHLLAGFSDAQNFRRAQELAQEVLQSDPSNLEARILLGNAYAGLKDLDQSVSEMQAILQEDPENLTARLNLGAFQYGLKNAAEAERTFQEAIRRHPQSAQAHLALANFYAVNGQLAEAETQLERAFQLAPEDPASIYTLLRFYLRLNRGDEAVAVLQRAIEASQDSSDLRFDLANLHLLLGDTQQGLAELRQLRAENPGHRRAVLRLAEVYLEVGDLQPAEEIVRSLLSENSQDAEAHFLNGRLHLLGGDKEMAMQEFDRAIQLNGSLVPAYLQKASLHLGKMELPQALEAVKSVLDIDRNNISARAGQAKILALQGNAGGALADANAVLSVQPQNVDALTARGLAYLQERKLEEAWEDFETLHQMDAENAFYLHRLGTVAALQGNTIVALNYFQRALKTNPELLDVMQDIVLLHVRESRFEVALRQIDAFMQRTGSRLQDDLLVLKGQVEMARGDHLAAESWLRRAIESDPENQRAYLLLGEVQLKRGNIRQAVAEVDQLLERNPRFVPALMLKAFYLDQLKEYELAIQYYKRTLDLSPDNHIAANNLAWIYCVTDQNITQALELARQARESQPEMAQYADTLGWVHYKMGNYTLAVNQLLIAVNSSPQPKAENYYRLGMAYYRKDDKMLARQSLRKALELSDSFDGADEARGVMKELSRSSD